MRGWEERPGFDLTSRHQEKAEINDTFIKTIIAYYIINNTNNSMLDNFKSLNHHRENII